MAEYIDRLTVLEKISEFTTCPLIYSVLDAIGEIPAADVVERKTRNGENKDVKF